MKEESFKKWSLSGQKKENYHCYGLFASKITHTSSTTDRIAIGQFF